MKLKFLGCGAGFSKGLGNNNAMIYDGVDPKNGYCLIDCGEQTRSKLVDLGLIDYLQGILVTHLHSDHIGGIEMLGFYWYFVKHIKLKLYLPTHEMAFQLMKHLEVTMAQIQDKNGNPVTASIYDYFDFYIGYQTWSFEQGSNLLFQARFIPVPHVPNKESCGVMILVRGKFHFYTSDIRSPVWRQIWFCEQQQYGETSIDGYIWHDCQMYDGGEGAVHAFLGDIKNHLYPPTQTGDKTPPRSPNVFLMHYNRKPTLEEQFEAQKWCGGFAEIDQEFEL